MEDNEQQTTDYRSDCLVEVAELLLLLDTRRSLQETLEGMAGEAQRVSKCEHIFLSRYSLSAGKFEPIAWCSSVTPTAVTDKQKFMSEKYLDNRIVVINDLGPYNYRLRSDMARLGLKSMLGIPIMGHGRLLGVIECFSRELAHFTSEVQEYLLLLTRQAALLWERVEQDKQNKWLTVENEFIHDVQRTEQLSDGLLLYRLGEALSALLAADGLAVFGLELSFESEMLQEVMAKGFSMNDIGMMRKAVTKDFLEKIRKMPTEPDQALFLKHPAEGKLLYIVPIIWRERLEGLVMYCWSTARPDDDRVQMERCISRMLQYTGIAMKRNAVYYNIQRISFNDPLTDLANRRLFDYLLSREFAKATQHNTPLSVLLLDLDHFKAINDQYGHQIGDEMLQQFARMLKQEFRQSSMPARYGGEEFVVIMPVSLYDAVAAAEKFRRRVEETLFTGATVYVTVSIGVAGLRESGGRRFTDAAAFLKLADQALYQAKQEGRNRVMAAR